LQGNQDEILCSGLTHTVKVKWVRITHYFNDTSAF